MFPEVNHKISIHTFQKKIEILQSMFSYHKSIKLKFNNNKIFRKSQILRHQILANTTIILKIAKEIRKIKVRRRKLYSI